MNRLWEALARAGTGLVWLAAASVGLIVLILVSPILLGAMLFRRLAGPR